MALLLGKNINPASFGYPGQSGALDVLASVVSVLGNAGYRCGWHDATGKGTPCAVIRALFQAELPAVPGEQVLGKLLVCVGVMKTKSREDRGGAPSTYSVVPSKRAAAAAAEDASGGGGGAAGWHAGTGASVAQAEQGGIGQTQAQHWAGAGGPPTSSGSCLRDAIAHCQSGPGQARPPKLKLN